MVYYKFFYAPSSGRFIFEPLFMHICVYMCMCISVFMCTLIVLLLSCLAHEIQFPKQL